MATYRNEWKYCCTEKELLNIEERTKGVLVPDSHGACGKYAVHSLYFDDLFDSCARDTEMGVGLCYKYRIRYYGDTPELIRLERKEKKWGRCRKFSCVISTQQFEQIMSGQIEEVFWNTDNKVLRRFCTDIWKRGFRPRIIVDYERTAYVEEISNVRVTLDTNIEASDDVAHFLDGNYISIPVLETGKHVLEVKFDHILPAYVKKLVYVQTLQQTSFSKYHIGLRKVQG